MMVSRVRVVPLVAEVRMTLVAWLGAGLAACSATSSAPSEIPREPAPVCPDAKAHLLQQLRQMPEQSLALELQGPVVQAHLAGVFQSGHLLDLRAGQFWLRTEGASNFTRGSIAELEASLVSLPAGTLYVAADPQTTIDELRDQLRKAPVGLQLQLLFQEPATKAEQPEVDLASRLMLEADPAERAELRKELAASASAPPEHSDAAPCAPLAPALRALLNAPDPRAWSQLRQALLETVPACSCESLNTRALAHWAVAEQRRGAARLGALPLDFLRDERCSASLARQSLAQLMQDIESFDAEFSGQYAEQSLDFTDVISNDRLGNYFCNALPGETFASLRKRKLPVFWKLPANAGSETCQRWEFQALQPGSPMGTMHRTDDSAPAVRMHYWQGAEEVRLFGPVASEDEKPTERRTWACDSELRLTGIDPISIQLSEGRWYFSEADCKAAAAPPATSTTCVTLLTQGRSTELATEPTAAADLSQPPTQAGPSESAAESSTTTAPSAP